ncbi:MAG: phosphoribosylformylglycinamidine synthase subunit PurL, partial [Patescibacteria group bacterium]
KRDPTLTEAIIWGIQGSEHSSYKSSRRHLKTLPTNAPNVILGPSEDSGIVEIAKSGKRKFGIVISHESHNHPSQVVPYEGAATGVGGIVRDIICMGAHVVAVADPLRFGEIKRNETKLIESGVVDGISGYGNPIGVPNIAGDVYFDKTFNDNCLVNVVSLGVLEADEIIHSYAPKGADRKKYDIIVVGKATDRSGMGGASFASAKLEEKDKEKNKGAVQEPNPFLKRHLLESTYELFKILKGKNMIDKVGFKDMGAGGIMCASVELAHTGGYGADIDIEKIHVGEEGLHPSVIACSETQERFCWVVPPEITQLVLDHYNKRWALPEVAKGARASVVGKITSDKKYRLRYRGAVICDAYAKDICEGLSYNRPYKEARGKLKEPKLGMPRDLGKVLLQVLGHENVACRKPIYESYDKNVQGISVVEAGQGDAGVIQPLLNRADVPDDVRGTAVSLSVDGNPRYGKISSYYEAVNAVCEGARNVAAVGTAPWCITDCLNYGNPEDPYQMQEMVDGIRGIGDAARGIGLRGFDKEPLPVVSGNVSLYNFSGKGSIAPQAIIATMGRANDASKIITPKFKETGNEIVLIGLRKDELGGSVYYDVMGELGANVPMPSPKDVRKEVELVLQIIENGLALACHDISDGGLAVTVAEMCLGGRGDGEIGAQINLTHAGWEDAKAKKPKPIRTDTKLFSETGGFILEMKKRNFKKAKKIARKLGVSMIRIGRTLRSGKFIVFDDGKEFIKFKLSPIRTAWVDGLRDKLR